MSEGILRSGRPDLSFGIDRGVLKTVIEGEGISLVGDHAAGSSVLNVSNGGFRSAGRCQIDGVVYRYTRSEDVLSISPSMTAAQDDGEPVVLLSPTGAPEANRVAVVDLDMDGDPESDVRASIPGDLAGYYPLGDVVAGTLVEVQDTPYGYVIVNRPVDTPALLRWEWDDVHALTSAEITTRTFTHTLKHSGIAEGSEFLAFINGVKLSRSQITALDADSGVVTVALSATPWETTADSVEFHYAYTTPDTVPNVSIPVSYVGSTTGNNPTSLAFPAGVQPGDIAVAVAIARTSGPPSISDSRFASTSYVFSVDTVVIGTWKIDTSSPAAVALAAPDLGGVQDGRGMLYVVRPQTPAPVKTPATDSGTKAFSATPRTIPGVPDVSAAVVILCTLGGIGGAYGWGLDASVSNQGQVGTYATIVMGLKAAVGGAVGDVIALPGSGDSYRGWMIGVGLI